MPQVIPTIFKQDAIQGEYPGELNEGSAYLLGRAFAQLLGARKVVVGRDARPSSESLANSFIRGLIQEGVTVHDLGWSSAPYLGFACQQADYDGSVLITGPNDSYTQNGFVLTRARSMQLTFDTGIAELRDRVRNGIPDYRPAPGQHLAKDYSTIYLDAITRGRIIKKLKVAIDTANGMAGLTVPAILQRFPQLEVVPIHFAIDGRFPNHLPDLQASDALIKLKGSIKINKCDLGVAFDGDGDQISFITQQGELIAGDFVGALLAQRQLLKHSAGVILYDVRSSRALSQEVKKLGGAALVTASDGTTIKKAMRDKQAVFATTSDRHYYFKDFYNLANGDYALLELLEILSNTDQQIQELLSPLKQYVQSGPIVLPVSDPEAALTAIVAKFKAGRQAMLDGISIEYPDWHMHLDIEPDETTLRFNIEAKTSEVLKEKRAQLIELLRPFSISSTS